MGNEDEFYKDKDSATLCINKESNNKIIKLEGKRLVA